MDVNLKGLFFLTQAVAQEMMKADRGGKIINIASKDSIHPTINMSPYDASKGGVVMLTKSMALEWAPHSIRVNSVLPGGIATPGAKKHASGALGGQPRIPLKKLGRPDDIAMAVLFLASKGADYMTGSSIIVDGGFLIS